LEPIDNRIERPTGSEKTNFQLINITTNGEYMMVNNPKVVVRSSQFSVKEFEYSKREILGFVLTPDILEFALLFLAMIVNIFYVRPQTGFGLLDPYFVVYWGFIAFILYTLRWSYIGVDRSYKRWQFNVSKSNENELMTGIIVDFKIIGILISLGLMLIGWLI
jgi:hypothetical protein